MQLSNKQILHYVYLKLTGAGFSFSLFALFYLSFSSFDLFDFSQMASNPIWWLYFYGYGIACSVVIDAIINALPFLKPYTVLLYILAGSAVFIVESLNAPGFILITVPLGATAALLFYVGMKLFTMKVRLTWILTLLIPICVAVSTMIHFTEKQDWAATRTDSAFTAHFTYFDGIHKIPIQLQKGDKLLFHVDFKRNGGAIGWSTENMKGQNVPMHQYGQRTMVQAKQDGTYFIVITGDHLTGSFTVKWDIK